MAHRFRVISTVKYGHFNEFVSAFKELNEIAGQRGWALGRVMAPLAGTNNQVVVEFEYPDLATFERETDAFFQDAEAMKVWRGTSDVVVEGSGYTELLSDVDLIA